MAEGLMSADFMTRSTYGWQELLEACENACNRMKA